MAYKRKTKDEYELYGNYGYGWDYILTEDDRLEAKKQLKCYNENEPGVPHKIIKRRVKIEEEK